MRIWFWCIGIFLISYPSAAQFNNLQSIKGLPSDEVYDLLADSKGFIWAAHSLGISRYDGVNFKDFNHPQATGAGITDIVEDKQGRIWCHNFNG
jgi:ligand-binding sensor domain-containing protein